MTSLWRRCALLGIVVALAFAPTTATADSNITISTSSSYDGFDSSITAGKWFITTTAVEGQITQVALRVSTLNGEQVTSLGWHPKLNQTVKTWDVVPPGTYRVQMRVWNNNASKVGSASFFLDTP